MRLRIGYELIYDCPQPTPMLLMLNVHSSRSADLVVPDHLQVSPSVPIRSYHDAFGNLCTRIVAPAGRSVISTLGEIEESGEVDPYVPDAVEHRVEDLPDDVLVFLLASRYCETELLSQTAWNMFGHITPGWGRVQAICDYVHKLILFDYQQARPTRTAWEAHNERIGVCRDYTHLAVTMCRCLNIPARVLHGLSGRCRAGAAVRHSRLRGVVRGVSGRRMAGVRSAQQRAQGEPHPDGARAGCDGRGDQHDVRSELLGRLQGGDRRDRGRRAQVRGRVACRSLAFRIGCPGGGAYRVRMSHRFRF